MSADVEVERYYVSAVEGYMVPRGATAPVAGVSVYVIDRLNCRGVVATYRSEDQRANRATHEGRRAQALRLAQLEAARLNRLHVHSERIPAGRQ